MGNIEGGKVVKFDTDKQAVEQLEKDPQKKGKAKGGNKNPPP